MEAGALPSEPIVGPRPVALPPFRKQQSDDRFHLLVKENKLFIRKRKFRASTFHWAPTRSVLTRPAPSAEASGRWLAPTIQGRHAAVGARGALGTGQRWSGRLEGRLDRRG